MCLCLASSAEPIGFDPSPSHSSSFMIATSLPWFTSVTRESCHRCLSCPTLPNLCFTSANCCHLQRLWEMKMIGIVYSSLHLYSLHQKVFDRCSDCQKPSFHPPRKDPWTSQQHYYRHHLRLNRRLPSLTLASFTVERPAGASIALIASAALRVG